VLGKNENRCTSAIEEEDLRRVDSSCQNSLGEVLTRNRSVWRKPAAAFRTPEDEPVSWRLYAVKNDGTFDSLVLLDQLYPDATGAQVVPDSPPWGVASEPDADRALPTEEREVGGNIGCGPARAVGNPSLMDDHVQSCVPG
jgi:hypothetical protein